MYPPVMRPKIRRHRPKNREWRLLKYTVGVLISQHKSRTCKSIRSTWTNALRWCWTLCLKSKTKSIRRLRSDVRAVKVFVVRARWTLAASIRWRASVVSMKIWANPLRFIRCRTCTLYVTWCRTCPISTINTRRFSRGCSASKCRKMLQFVEIKKIFFDTFFQWWC